MTTMYKVGGANRPMCTNPEGCPGVNNPAHRAIFRHQCPKGKSCPQQESSSHCEEFAHDLFFQEERNVDQTTAPSLPQHVKPLLDIGLRGNGEPEPPRPQWEDPERVYTMPHVGPSNSIGTIGSNKIVGGGGGSGVGAAAAGNDDSTPLFPAPNSGSQKTAATNPWATTGGPLTGSQQTFTAPSSSKQQPQLPQQQYSPVGQGAILGQVVPPTSSSGHHQQQQQPVYMIAPPQPGQMGGIPVATATPYAPHGGMAVPLASGVGGFSGVPVAAPGGSVPFGYAPIGAAQAPPTSALRPEASPFPGGSQAPPASSAGSTGTGASHPFPSRHRMPAPR